MDNVLVMTSVGAGVAVAASAAGMPTTWISGIAVSAGAIGTLAKPTMKFFVLVGQFIDGGMSSVSKKNDGVSKISDQGGEKRDETTKTTQVSK